MSRPELLSIARELRGLIESEAEAVEQKSTMTEPVVDALVDSGLFRLLVPKEFGGFEADPATIVDVCEEISFADGSVGWAFAQNTTVMAYTAYLDPEYAKPLAGARAGAGMFAPLGVAHREDGGFRISGSYKFGSGSGHADYIGGAAMEMHDGEMAPFVGGLPQIRGFIVPADRVKLKGNWDVMGLRGTGSYDFEVPEQFVEAGRTFSVFHSTITTGGPIYGLGPIPLGVISSAAWSLGVARRALHESAEIGKAGRTRLGSVPMREHPTYQRDFGIHTIAVKAACLMVKESYHRAVEAIGSGEADDVRAECVRETFAASNYATRVSKAAVTFAYEAAGSHGLRNPSRLQRCFRDIYVGAAHQAFDDRNYVELAKTALGLEPSPF